MDILIFSTTTDFKTFSKTLKKLNDDANCIHVTNTEQLLNELLSGSISLVIVAVNGALGMEIAFSVRNVSTDIPLFWFSDDIHFGPQAYRLNCNYFSNKPITEMIILTATQKLNAKSYFQ